MSDSRDLFGKIDALFEKRDPDALLDKGLEHEDFPVLTEVVSGGGDVDTRVHAVERRALQRRDLERRLGERRESARQDQTTPLPGGQSAEFDALVAAVETRLSDLFIRQQLRMEEALRHAIREELEKYGKHL
jgi:hypothetical protein